MGNIAGKAPFMPVSFIPVTSTTAAAVFRPWRALVPVITAALFLLLATPAFAEVEGVVSRDERGASHLYCYEELLDSYALELLGLADGLYDDFNEKTPTALLGSDRVFFDYEGILDAFALAVIGGERFDLYAYLRDNEARRAVMPAVIYAVTLEAGRIVRTEQEIPRDGPGGDSEMEVDLPPPASDPGNPPGPVPEPEKPVPPVKPAPEPEKPVPPVKPAPEPEKPVTETPIAGPPEVALERARQWAQGKNAHQRFVDIAPLYWEYGARTGIRPEVLYAQAALETGFGRFGGIVTPEHNNWAGIKTARASGDTPEDHERFATPDDGVRAHFNHMSAYLGLSPVGEPHPRYHVVKRISWAGTVKTVEELSGKWAPSPTYHVRLVEMIAEMR